MDEVVQSADEIAPSRRRTFTFEPGGSLWWYVGRMAGVAFFGALLVASLLQPLFNTGDPRADMLEDNFVLAVFAMVIVAPPLETLMMALFFGIATFFSANAHRLAVVSALCWALMHIVNSPVNAIAVLWPFYIMSRVYLAWRPHGFWKTVGVTTLTHAGINGLAVAIAGLALAFDDSTAMSVSSPQYEHEVGGQVQYIP